MSKNHNIPCSYILLKPTKIKAEVEGYRQLEIVLHDMNKTEIILPNDKKLFVEGSRLDFWKQTIPFAEIKMDCTKEGYIRLFSDEFNILYSSFDHTFELVKK